MANQPAYVEFDLKGFKLQNGTVLDLKLAYQTYGSLNKAKDNAVLYPYISRVDIWIMNGLLEKKKRWIRKISS